VLPVGFPLINYHGGEIMTQYTVAQKHGEVWIWDELLGIDTTGRLYMPHAVADRFKSMQAQGVDIKSNGIQLYWIVDKMTRTIRVRLPAEVVDFLQDQGTDVARLIVHAVNRLRVAK